MVISDEETVAEYYDRKKQLEELGRDFKDVITHPTYSLPFLQAGRLVTVQHNDKDYGWGVVVNFNKRQPPKVRSLLLSQPSRRALSSRCVILSSLATDTTHLLASSLAQAGRGAPPVPVDETPQSQYIVDVLLNCASGSVVSKDRNSGSTNIIPCPPGEKGEPLVVPVLLSTISSISHIRIFMPKDLRPLDGRNAVLKAVMEVKKRFPEGIALLDPIENMGIKDDEFKSLIKVRLRFSLPCQSSLA
jgi:ATP-dependent RNA helicase DOB1